MKKNSTLLLMLSLFVFEVTCAQTIYWSEDFENDWTSNWYAENGIWNVGLPTNPNGPDTTHSGIACAAIGLNSGSNINTTTRFVSINNITIPSAVQNPRLRFWQWFDLGNVSGRVQIKTATSAWKNLTSYSYGVSCSNVWSVEEISLSKWADSSVQIAFLFESSGSNGWTGWFLDDLEIRIGPYYFLNPESFENGYGDWSVERGTWEIGPPPLSPGPGGAYSGNNCAAIPLAGYPDNGINTRLRSAWFTMPSAPESPAMSFWHWFILGPNANPHVEIRTTNNLTWQQISITFSGNSLGWSYYHIPLDSYSDSTVQICFFFSSSGGNNYPGYWIDDINIDGYVGTTVMTNNFLELNIYPNPTSNILNLLFHKTIKQGAITLFDLVGTKVYSEKISDASNTVINTNNFSEGVYFLKFDCDERSILKKVIVSKN